MLCIFNHSRKNPKPSGPLSPEGNAKALPEPRPAPPARCHCCNATPPPARPPPGAGAPTLLREPPDSLPPQACARAAPAALAGPAAFAETLLGHPRRRKIQGRDKTPSRCSMELADGRFYKLKKTKAKPQKTQTRTRVRFLVTPSL